jgi:hypothetical protein
MRKFKKQTENNWKCLRDGKTECLSEYKETNENNMNNKFRNLN